MQTRVPEFGSLALLKKLGMVACICDTPHITQDGWQGSLAEMISSRLCENLSQKVRWREREMEEAMHMCMLG